MRVHVIGGGIAGPVAAMALQRAGIEAVVHEASEGPAESRGLFLGLGVNGMRVLRTLDLLEPVLAADNIPTPRMEFHGSSGRSLGSVSSGWLDEHTPSFTLMRGTLQRRLADEAIRRGVEIRYGRRLVEAAQDTDAVRARFDDGSHAEADVLIGADGIHSRVRTSVFPDAPAPRFTGLLNLGGKVPAADLPPTPGTMHMVWGRRAFFGYTIRPNGEAWWFANLGAASEPSRGELEATPHEEWKRRLLAIFESDPAIVTTLIERADGIGAWPIHDMPSIPAWHRGRIALLGDAAHAVSPSAGQGASMALEDAIELARCLRDVRAPERALATYESLRRDRAERIVATGRRRGNYKAPANRAALFLRDLLMPAALRLFATEKSMAWIYDYDIKWDERAA